MINLIHGRGTSTYGYILKLPPAFGSSRGDLSVSQGRLALPMSVSKFAQHLRGCGAISTLNCRRVSVSFLFMECTATVQCPFCGAQFDLVLDTSLPNQRFTTDCEVCCRPFDVVAECEPGEIVSIEVETG